jgi:DNA-binding transcriptional MocR family regulator
MAIPVEIFALDQSGDGTLQHQRRKVVTEGILSGRFRSRDRLPSSRKLAARSAGGSPASRCLKSQRNVANFLSLDYHDTLITLLGRAYTERRAVMAEAIAATA